MAPCAQRSSPPQQPRFPISVTIPLRGDRCRACCGHGRRIFSVDRVVVLGCGFSCARVRLSEDLD